jgi:hypothetical protein
MRVVDDDAQGIAAFDERSASFRQPTMLGRLGPQVDQATCDKMTDPDLSDAEVKRFLEAFELILQKVSTFHGEQDPRRGRTEIREIGFAGQHREVFDRQSSPDIAGHPPEIGINLPGRIGLTLGDPTHRVAAQKRRIWNNMERDQLDPIAEHALPNRDAVTKIEEQVAMGVSERGGFGPACSIYDQRQPEPCKERPSPQRRAIQGQSRSKIAAMPWPPPMHIVTSA